MAPACRFFLPGGLPAPADKLRLARLIATLRRDRRFWLLARCPPPRRGRRPKLAAFSPDFPFVAAPFPALFCGRGSACTATANYPRRQTAPSPRGAARYGRRPSPAFAARVFGTRGKTAPAKAAADAAGPSRQAGCTSCDTVRCCAVHVWAGAPGTNRRASARGSPDAYTASAAFVPCRHPRKNKKARDNHPERSLPLAS